jgi:hypothetical protein
MVNAKPYVGQTTRKTPEERWKNHIKGSIGQYLYNAYQKYGKKNFSYSVLCECPDEKLNEYEQAYIRLYSSMCPSLGGIGYNCTLGGLAGGKLSSETKKKISAGNKGKIISEETKQKLREFRTGLKASKETKERMKIAQTGRIYSEETRKKISSAQKGKIISEENKQKLREFHTGLKASKETKERMRIAQTGRIHSEETRKKISAAQKGKIISEERKVIIGAQKSKKVSQLTLEGVFIKTHLSAREAGKETGSNPAGIGRCCNGKQKTCGEFKWKWPDHAK